MPKVAFENSYITIWKGSDCLRFLDSLSSNKVIDLSKDSIIQTAIISKHAKIIDFVTVLNLGDFLAVIGFKPNLSSMIDYVTPKILQSSVEIIDITTLNDLIIIYDEAIDLEIGTCSSVDNVTLAKITDNFSICVASKKVGYEFEIMGDDFTEWRIQNLIPWYEYEIVNSTTPYGCGLNKYVHDNKGCFTGQEILTRMRSRNSGIKTLVKLNNADIEKQKITTKGKTMSLAILRSVSK